MLQTSIYERIRREALAPIQEFVLPMVKQQAVNQALFSLQKDQLLLEREVVSDQAKFINLDNRFADLSMRQMQVTSSALFGQELRSCLPNPHP